MLTFLRRTVGDRHRAEELSQKVFLAVRTRRRAYQYPRPFRAWLFGIAVNKCRAEFRRPTPLPAEITAPAAEVYEYYNTDPRVRSGTARLTVLAQNRAD